MHYDMSRPPEQYAHQPNFWRVACELSKFKCPHKAANVLLTLAGPLLEEGGDGKQ